MKIKLDNLLKGKILDIDGDGEGVIGRIYQRQVTAIDNAQEELNETPNVCKKMFNNFTCSVARPRSNTRGDNAATLEGATKQHWRGQHSKTRGDNIAWKK